MENNLVLENFEINFRSSVFKKKDKISKGFQNFLDGYFSIMIENLTKHINYVRSYYKENNITLSDPIVIQYIAFNFCMIYTYCAIGLLEKEKCNTISPVLALLVFKNFAHLEDDIKERHGSFEAFVVNNFNTFKSEYYELYLRKLLITDAEKKIIVPFVDAKKIKKKQVKKNTEYFSSLSANFFDGVYQLMTPEFISVCKAQEKKIIKFEKLAASRKSEDNIANQEINSHKGSC